MKRVFIFLLGINLSFSVYALHDVVNEVDLPNNGLGNAGNTMGIGTDHGGHHSPSIRDVPNNGLGNAGHTIGIGTDHGGHHSPSIGSTKKEAR